MFTRAAHAAIKITVGRSRWWGLHKFGVPIKMISLSALLQSGTLTQAMRTGACGSFMARECCAFGYMYIGIQLVEPREELRRTDATIGAIRPRPAIGFGHPLSLSHVHCSPRSVRAPAVLHCGVSPPFAPDRLGSLSARMCRWRTRTLGFPRPDCLYLMCLLPLRPVP